MAELQSRFNTSRMRIDGIALALALVLVVAWGVLWWPYTVDDTYITLHYARTIADGIGAVFNPGEHVEGYSCPAWVFLLAGCFAVGIDALITAKFSGIVCSLLLCVLLYYTLRRMSIDPRIRAAAILGMGTLPGLQIHGVSGMETLPFTLLLATAVSLSVLTHSRSVKSIVLPLLLILIAAMRPEGMLLFPVLIGISWIREKSVRIRAGLLSAGLVVVILLLLRYSYYGRLLPNTWLAKPSPLLHYLLSAPFSTASFLELIRSIGELLLASPGSAPGALLLVLIIAAYSLRRSDTCTWTALATVVVGATFVAYAAHDWMPGHRFALPFAYPLMLLAARGFDGLQNKMAASDARNLSSAFLIIPVLLITWNMANTAYWWNRYAKQTVNPALDSSQYIQMGRWLNRNSKDTDVVLCYEIGAIGYFSRRQLLDHEGLISWDIAGIIHTTPGYDAIRYGNEIQAMNSIVSYCVDRAPDWLLVRSKSAASMEIGRPVPWPLASETIQQALLKSQAHSMVLRKIFTLKPRDTSSTDAYLLLQRIDSSTAAVESPRP